MIHYHTCFKMSILCLSDQIPPVIGSVLNVSIRCGSAYTPTDLAQIPSVTDNLDLNPTLTYRDEPTTNCSSHRIWTAEDSAGNTAYLTQTIWFIALLPPIITSPPYLVVACGSIESTDASFTHNMLAYSHPCDRPVTVTYTDSANLTQCGFTFSRVWDLQDDCGRTSVFTQVIRVLGQQFPDAPPNGQIGTPINQELRWPQYPSATSYQVYIWRELEGDRPARPTIVTTQRSYTPSPEYPPGTQMLWQIEYVLDVNMTVPSPVWGFETEHRPDLNVTDVTIPETAFSGQSFDVTWTVLNTGTLGVTTFFYFDDIYLSRTLSISDGRRVRRVTQRRFLDPNDGYRVTTEVNLADSDIGVFYVFVIADATYAVSL